MTTSVYNHKTGRRHRHKFKLSPRSFSMLQTRGYILVCNCDKCKGKTPLNLYDEVVSKRSSICDVTGTKKRVFYLVAHLKELHQMVI